MIPRPASPDIHQALVDLADRGDPFAVAVVLKVTGSTPRKAGTKALVDSSGAIVGTIGGGEVEADTQRRAVQAVRSGRPVVFDFALEGHRAEDDRPLCGGSMRILIDPTAAEHRAVYARAVEARRRRRRGVLLTAVHVSPACRVAVQWFPQDAVPGDVGFPGAQAVRSALGAQAPQLLVRDSPGQGARLEVLVEPLIPPPLLVVAGGGHVGQALALQGHLVGFDVMVLDDRSEFVAPALYPEGVTTRCGDISQALAELPVADDTYVAVVTRGHRHDRAAVAACIHKPVAYLGMIGSRRKVSMIRADLLGSGAAGEEELRRLHAPIGLDIGAQTVPEIATSIVAQLIAVRRKGAAPGLSIG